MSLEEMGHFLCEMQYEANDCCGCPAKEKCFPSGDNSGNGWINWLKDN